MQVSNLRLLYFKICQGSGVRDSLLLLGKLGGNTKFVLQEKSKYIFLKKYNIILIFRENLRKQNEVS